MTVVRWAGMWRWAALAHACCAKQPSSLQALYCMPFLALHGRQHCPCTLCSHHICLEVEDIAASMAHVGARVRLLDKRARIGAHGLPVVFAHPKDMCGVLTELEEVPRR